MNSYLARTAVGALIAVMSLAPGAAHVAATHPPPAAHASRPKGIRPATPAGCAANGTYNFIGLSVPAYGANYAGGAVTSQGTLGFSGVAAGQGNLACDWDSFIGAGNANVIGGDDDAGYSVIGGGSGNSIDGTSYTGSMFSFVGSGSYNAIRESAGGAIVAGSNNSVAGSKYAFLGSGLDNSIGGALSGTIVGGDANTVSGPYDFIGNGGSNVATTTAAESFIGGGNGNTVASSYSFIGAGYDNGISAFGAAIVAGQANVVRGEYGAVVAGQSNVVSGEYGAIIAGQQNTVSGEYGTVPGGYLNLASGVQATIGGGYGNLASGKNGTIPGGTTNVASGANSFAAGTKSTAAYTGDFVWSDYVSGSSGVAATAQDQFVARATGGFYLYSSPTLTGVALAPGSGAWSTLSDRSVKTGVAHVDDERILAQLAMLPISEWSYTAQGSGIRHLGPMAQDFRAAFGLGEDDRHISTVDEEGVALAAIKALERQAAQKDRRLAELLRADSVNARKLATLEAKYEKLEARLDALAGKLVRTASLEGETR